MCLAQGHNTLTPVRLKPSAPQSRVNTLPLSHCAPPNGKVTTSQLDLTNENQEVSLFPAGIVSKLS